MRRKPEISVLEAELDLLPETVIGQLIDGRLVVLPRPAAAHTEAASELGAFLIRYFRHGDGGPGGWVILDEPEIRFGADLLIPDLAGWRRERFLSPHKGPYLVPPDWICEVLSPTTARVDRSKKLPIFARFRVGHVWLVDPDAQTLEVYRRQEGSWLLLGTWGGGDRVQAEPFEAIELDLLRLWGEPRVGEEEPAGDFVHEPVSISP